MQGAPLAPAGSCRRPSPYLQHHLNLLLYYCNNTCLITISCISTTYWTNIQIFGSCHLLSYRRQVTKNRSTKSRGHTQGRLLLVTHADSPAVPATCGIIPWQYKLPCRVYQHSGAVSLFQKQRLCYRQWQYTPCVSTTPCLYHLPHLVCIAPSPYFTPDHGAIFQLQIEKLQYSPTNFSNLPDVFYSFHRPTIQQLPKL